MATPASATILDALRPIQDPDFKRSIVDLGFVKNAAHRRREASRSRSSSPRPRAR